MLRADPVSALPLALFLLLALSLYAAAGVFLTPAAAISVPGRIFSGYPRWASVRTSRFLIQTCLLLALLASAWILGVQSAYQFTIRCGACEQVAARGFLDRQLRLRCQAGLARLIVYRPLHSSAVVLNSITCLDRKNFPYPALLRHAGLLQCADPVAGRRPLQVAAIDPPELQIGRLLRYRLHGEGFTRTMTLDVQHATFVGSAFNGLEDRIPAAVDEHGKWADFYVYLAAAPADEGPVAMTLHNEFHEATEFRSPVKAAAR